jgi:hypothetical protein
MKLTLIIAIFSLALWAWLLASQPPSGWIHVPLAVGVTLLVRWIALRDGAGSVKGVNGKR